MKKNKQPTYDNVVKFAEREQQSSPDRLYTVEVGLISGLNPEGCPLVTLAESIDSSPLVALSQVEITSSDIHKECTLAFVGGDPMRPLILGLLQTPKLTTESEETEIAEMHPDDFLDIDSEEAVVIRSDQSIILQTGKSRIELYPDGHINLQGVYINSQAYGPNRIKGGSVKLN